MKHTYLQGFGVVGMKDINYLDPTIGPQVIAEEIGNGRFRVKCTCGWGIVSNPKYRLNKEDVQRVMSAHLELEHSDVYAKEESIQSEWQTNNDQKTQEISVPQNNK